jgi:polyisoprenoid-binding protein YceI
MLIKIPLWFLFLLPSLVYGQTSSVSFIIKNAGFKVNGEFTEVKHNLNFLPENISQSSFSIVVDVNSIDTGIASRDKHIMKEKYFGIEDYPQILFSSTSVYKNNGQLFVTGKLTMKAATKQIIIPFSYNKEGNFLEGQLRINRSDYGVGRKSLIMGNAVIINLHFSLVN